MTSYLYELSSLTGNALMVLRVLLEACSAATGHRATDDSLADEVTRVYVSLDAGYELPREEYLGLMSMAGNALLQGVRSELSGWPDKDDTRAQRIIEQVVDRMRHQYHEVLRTTPDNRHQPTENFVRKDLVSALERLPDYLAEQRKRASQAAA